VDLDDGVLCVQFHSKLNTIGGDAVEMLHAGVTEAAANFRHSSSAAKPSIFGGRESRAAPARSAGGGLGRDRRDGPRVPGRDDGTEDVAGAGRRRAGGTRDWRRMRDLPAHGSVAAAETYRLVELGVGLIPAGGGSKKC
jgi:3-hydroxyacyl-CoA dehydrogenase